MWRFIKVLLPARVQAAVSFLGEDGRAQLAEMMGGKAGAVSSLLEDKEDAALSAARIGLYACSVERVHTAGGASRCEDSESLQQSGRSCSGVLAVSEL